MGDDSGSSRRPNETVRNPSRGTGSKPDASNRFLSASDKLILSDAIRHRVAGKVGGKHGFSAGMSGDADLRPVSPEDIERRYHDLPKYQLAANFRGDLRQSLLDPDPRFHNNLAMKLQEAEIPILTASCVLFDPVAAELGNMWCEDQVNFIQVAVASSRLNIMVSHLVRQENISNTRKGPPPTILLARTSGGNHTLGLAIVTACFQDAGWKVSGGPDLEVGSDFFKELGKKHYALMGLSVGHTHDSKECADTLAAAVRHSRNARLKTALGGPAVVTSPESFFYSGADIIATSARDAVEFAERLVD